MNDLLQKVYDLLIYASYALAISLAISLCLYVIARFWLIPWCKTREVDRPNKRLARAIVRRWYGVRRKYPYKKSKWHLVKGKPVKRPVEVFPQLKKVGIDRGNLIVFISSDYPHLQEYRPIEDDDNNPAAQILYSQLCKSDGSCVTDKNISFGDGKYVPLRLIPKPHFDSHNAVFKGGDQL